MAGKLTSKRWNQCYSIRDTNDGIRERTYVRIQRSWKDWRGRNITDKRNRYESIESKKWRTSELKRKLCDRKIKQSRKYCKARLVRGVLKEKLINLMNHPPM